MATSILEIESLAILLLVVVSLVALAVHRLEEFLQQSQAATLVIGSPGEDSATNTFDAAKLGQFVEHLRAALGIEVLVA